MKKLLCVLMLGMVFGQDAISTREYSITIENNLSVNIYDLIGDEANGYYSIDYIIYDAVGETIAAEENCAWDTGIWVCNYYCFNYRMHLRTNFSDTQINLEANYDTYNCDIKGGNGTPLIISENYPELTINFVGNYLGELDGFNIIVSIKGRFPDTDIGLQGDMNNDEILDILDIVLMVNTILDGEQSFNMLDTIDSFSRI